MKRKQLGHIIKLLKKYKLRSLLVLIGVCISSFALSCGFIVKNNMSTDLYFDIEKIDEKSLLLKGNFDANTIDDLKDFDLLIKTTGYKSNEIENSKVLVKNLEYRITTNTYLVNLDFYNFQIPSAKDCNMLVTTHLIAGRNFNEDDILLNRNVIIINEEYSSLLFGKGKGLYEFITIGDKDYQVIGLLSSTDDVKYNINSSNKEIVMDVYRPNCNYINSKYDSIICLSENEIDSVYIDKCCNYLKESNQSIGYFDCFSNSTFMDEYENNKEMFSNFVDIILIVSYLTTILFLLTIMLFFIKERISEFGLKKAIGATNDDISFQILIEMMFIGIVGGIIGIILGIVTTGLIYSIRYGYVYIPITSYTLPTILSLIEVIIVSIIPMITVSKWNINKTMRYE